MELLWLIFLFLTLQPLMRQRYLMLMRRYKIAQLQGRRQSRVITLVHRQETMRFFGFPLMRYIDIDDSEEVTRAIHTTDTGTPIDIVLHTPGGLVLAAVQIARAIQRHSGKVTVFVPHLAMSGGTLVALAADEIVMCPHAMLGPIDPQVGGFPAASLMKVKAEKPIAEIDDQTLILADVGAKATQQVARTTTELLRRQLGDERAAAVAETLTSGKWTHDYPIDADEARELGLKIGIDMPEEVLELMQLYPQPMTTAPTVEYLPKPARRVAGRPN